ncbi:saccharopine dehydrogenase NADP-binding domain-containing protein [Candidatus Binatia bacterium]|nr:saccharopine dehydrogenase NADP-binding domain-containing protein [Candidatus Binatia bacterium]
MARDAIGVLGATGYTGRLIVDELRRQGTPVVIAARNPGKLARVAAQTGCESLVADVNDLASLDRLTQRCRVLINTAGPFVDYGEPVVRAAIANRCHYVDTTGEQPFMKAMLAHDAPARERGVAVVSALAFEIAVGDCATALAGAGFREIGSAYLTYVTRFHPSQGTQRTVLRMLQTTGYAYEGGAWIEATPASVLRTVVFPPPLGRVTAVSFPAAEVITVPHHLPVREVRVFMAVPAALAHAAHWFAGPLTAALRGPLGRLAAGVIGTDTGGPSEATRHTDDFTILVEVRGVRAGVAAVERLLVRGHDPYGLTAAIAATGAARMAAPGYDRCGVLPPAAAFDPRPLLDGLSGAGLSYKRLESARA